MTSKKNFFWFNKLQRRSHRNEFYDRRRCMQGSPRRCWKINQKTHNFIDVIKVYNFSLALAQRRHATQKQLFAFRPRTLIEKLHHWWKSERIIILIRIIAYFCWSRLVKHKLIDFCISWCGVHKASFISIHEVSFLFGFFSSFRVEERN